MNTKEIRNAMYNIEVTMKTNVLNEEEKNNLKEQLKYYRKEIGRVAYNEALEKHREQKKEGEINEIRK